MNPFSPKYLLFTFCAWLCVLFVGTNPIAAQKAPELGYVFPPVVVPGAKTEVQLGGYDFTNDMQFFVHDEQVKLDVKSKPGRFFVPEPPYWFGEKGRSNAFPIPREIQATLEVAKNHPAGLVRWQVANANGSSATAVFYVSDLSEVIENRFREEPQQLKTLPQGVSGRISKIAEIDRYSFRSEKDGPITIELFARTLGADFNGVLEVRDSSGRLVADAADTEGIDTALTFAAKADRKYTVSLHDLDFRGNRAFVYRLAVTPGPRVVATIPAKGERGSTQEMQFIGIGIASGNARLETITKKVSFPASAGAKMLRYRLETSHGLAVPFEIPLSGQVESILQMGDGQPRKRTVPFAVTGRLSRPAEFVWTANKGDLFQVQASSRAINGKLDLALEIKDASGKTLAFNDDFAGSADPLLIFKAPSKGEFSCVVSDLSGREGKADSVYRLSISQPAPGYSLAIPQQLSFKLGTKSKLQINVQRTGGYKAAIPIRLVGLPKGVTPPPADKLVVPADQSTLAIELQSDEKSAAVAASIQIVGKVEGESEVYAQATAAGNLCPRDPVAERVRHLLLATTLTPSFAVELIDKNRQRAVHRGTTYPAPFIIKRNDGFDGEIALQMLAKQGRHRQGIRAPILPVPNGASNVLYPCFMPEWLETDRTTRMVVLGVGKQEDPLGNIREVTKQADARITMILEGALLKVSHELKELTVNSGEVFEIPCIVARSSKLPVPVKLQLIVPKELKGFVRTATDSIELAPTESNARLKVLTSGDEAVRGRWPLKIKATALQDHRWLVASETELVVQFNGAVTDE